MNKFVISLCTLLIFTHAKAIATPAIQQSNLKTFIEWCNQKSTLPKATKHTVEVLLKEAGTQDCQQANQKLSNLTALSLGRNQISDVKPLSSLTNLTELNLAHNLIKDKTCPLEKKSVCKF